MKTRLVSYWGSVLMLMAAAYGDTPFLHTPKHTLDGLRVALMGGGLVNVLMTAVLFGLPIGALTLLSSQRAATWRYLWFGMPVLCFGLQFVWPLGFFGVRSAVGMALLAAIAHALSRSPRTQFWFRYTMALPFWAAILAPYVLHLHSISWLHFAD